MARLNTPNGAPEWMRTFVLQLNSALQSLSIPNVPVQLPTFKAGSGPADPTRTLPKASSYAACQVWVSDLSRTAVSNGSAWIRQDTGASI